MRAQHSQKHSVDPPNRVRVRHYEPDFKRKVALFAQRKGNQAAKKRFGISESNIRRWRKIQKESVAEKVALKSTVGNKNSKRKNEDIPNKIDSMPLEQRLKTPVASTSEQEQILLSHALSPTKLKVTRQTKPREPSPKSVIPIPVEEICLKWNSHHGNMQSMFPALLLKEQYVDATLVAEGQTLKCHRIILSSCSPYFEEVLSSISPYQHPVLFMKDTPYWILKCLCDFMYTGEVLIPQNKLNELLSTAENLKIKGLAGKPDIPNEDLLREALHRTIKEEKKDEPVIEKEPEKKEIPKEKKRYHNAPPATPPVITEPPTPKNVKVSKTVTTSDIIPVRASKIPKLSYNDPPVLKTSAKLTKSITTFIEPSSLKIPSKVLRSSSNLKKIERSDKLLIKEAISKGDILDPFDLLEPVYEEVQKESKPPSIPGKAKEASKNVPLKKNMQKKVKKRKISDDRDESPPPVLSRKGTRSRPNKKIPRFYHSGFDNSTPKSQESREIVETTIVREPHTSQAESHAPSLGIASEPNADLHSNQAEPHIDQTESHMDQADPLFQLEDIKAEPFDVEDSTIEIEDSVVNFSEADTSITEEELLDESYDPIISFGEKRVEAKPFKKIRVTRQQVLINAEKAASMVKIVDVDKIKVSADVLEEDPLTLNSTMDNSIKIMNVESINESVERTSEISEVEFKISEQEEIKEIEENPLGFQITSVVSEVDENQKEDKPSEPVCQIGEVFSETEVDVNKKRFESPKKLQVTRASDKINISSRSRKRSEENATPKTCVSSDENYSENMVTDLTAVKDSVCLESAHKQMSMPDFDMSDDLNETADRIYPGAEELKETPTLTNSAEDSEIGLDELEKETEEFDESTDKRNSIDVGLNKLADGSTKENNGSDKADDADKIVDHDSLVDDPGILSDDPHQMTGEPDKMADDPVKDVHNLDGMADEETTEDVDIIIEYSDKIDSQPKTADDHHITDNLRTTTDDSDKSIIELKETTDDPEKNIQNSKNPSPVTDSPFDLANDSKELFDTSRLAEFSEESDDPKLLADDPISSDEPDIVFKNSQEIVDDQNVAADDLNNAADVLTQANDDPKENTEDSNKIVDNLNETTDDLNKTIEDTNKTTDFPAGDSNDITDDLNDRADYLNEAADNSKEAGDVRNTADSSCTADDSGIAQVPTDCLREPSDFSGNRGTADYLSSHAGEEQLSTSNALNTSAKSEVINDIEQSEANFQLRQNIASNSEQNSCLEETFDQAMITDDLSNTGDIDMPADESRTKDPVLANAVPYTNEDLPGVGTGQNEDIQMEVCEESYAEGTPSFDQPSNSFDLVTDVSQNEASSYSAPGFHIAQVISEQIALNECRLTNQPMDTSDTCFQDSVAGSNELEMIVNDLTKIVGESQRLDPNMEHEDIAESLENLLEK